MDPMTITTVLSAGTQALTLLKAAAEALKSAGRPEAVGDLVEVQLAMMDLLQKQQALIEENRMLHERVGALEGELQTKGELVFHHNVYWRQQSDGVLEGPYSPSQWDLHHKLVRMRILEQGSYSGVEKIDYFEPNSKDRAYVPAAFARANKVSGID